MHKTTDRFQRAIRTSGQRKTKVDVFSSFGNTHLYEDVPILDGSITADRNSDVRRSGQITLGTHDLVDLLTNTDSHPFGMEFKIYHGVVYPNQEEELVLLGVFNIDDISWPEGKKVTPTLILSDRSSWIRRAKMHAPKDYSGFWAKDVFQTVVDEAADDVTVVIDSSLSDVRLPGGSSFDSDRWEILNACAQALGAEVYFDRFGVLIVEPIVDPTTTTDSTVWEFNVGEGFTEIRGETEQQKVVSRPTGILTGANRSVSREQTFNAVAVYGAASGGTTAQPFALAYDNDPESPTYYEGKFGKVTKRIDNPLLTTVNQCAEAAAAELKTVLGYSRGLSFTAIGNPALDEGDYVLFTFLNGVQEAHLLDSFSYPLGSGEFSGETKTQPARQTTSVGITRGSTSEERGPTNPGKPTISAIQNTSFRVTWAHSKAGSNPLARYEVLFGDRVLATVPADRNTTMVQGLASGTRFVISVRAVDYAGRESAPSQGVQVRTTGPTGPPSNPVKFSRDFHAVWSGTFSQGGSRLINLDDKMYQGYKNDGNGNLRSLCGFDHTQIMGELDGAYITGCYLTLYFKDWAGSKGTAVVGFHNYSSQPNTWQDKNVFQDKFRSSGWPQPGKRRLSLGTGVGNSFKSGVYRGVALGPGPTTSSVYRGYAVGAFGGDLQVVLTFTYEKES